MIYCWTMIHTIKPVVGKGCWDQWYDKFYMLMMLFFSMQKQVAEYMEKLRGALLKYITK